jgi:malonyl CoA-acyl carrier protein transacylase
MMTTTPDDARDLLIAAGISQGEITAEAIQMAQVYNEVVMRLFAKMLAERIAEKFFTDADGVFNVTRAKLQGDAS